MKIKDYLNENVTKTDTKLKFQNGETADITTSPNVVLIKNKAEKATNTVMVTKHGNNINTEDSNGNKNNFKNINDLIKYLNDNGLVYFEGYSRI